jgi:hypothetical protein
VDLRHGDLILMDAHQWHGNVPLVCECGNRLDGPCPACGAERISVVSYLRSNIVSCGTPQQEQDKALALAERRSGLALAADAAEDAEQRELAAATVTRLDA